MDFFSFLLVSVGLFVLVHKDHQNEDNNDPSFNCGCRLTTEQCWDKITVNALEEKELHFLLNLPVLEEKPHFLLYSPVSIKGL